MENLEYKYKGYTFKGHQWLIEKPKNNILIVTGMAEHSGRYDDFAKFLNSQGYNVFCIDHFGQGKNGTLGEVPENYFFIEEDMINSFITLLRNQYGLKVFIFSFSMGSFLTQGFIEKYSSNVDKVVIAGSNGRNFLTKVGGLLANLIVTKKNKNKKANLLHKLSIGAYEITVKDSFSVNSWISYNEENVKAYDEDPFSGFRCTNGFFKEFIKGLNSIQKNKNIIKINKDLPILITSGEDDAVGNFKKGVNSLYKLYKKNGLNVSIKLYENMRHEILNEKEHQKVYEDLLEFFDK